MVAYCCIDHEKGTPTVTEYNMVLSLSLLAIGLLAAHVAATADSAAQPNHEWLEQVYGAGDTGGREKRQIAEGGKHWATES